MSGLAPIAGNPLVVLVVVVITIGWWWLSERNGIRPLRARSRRRP